MKPVHHARRQRLSSEPGEWPQLLVHDLGPREFFGHLDKCHAMKAKCASYRKLSREFVCRGPGCSDHKGSRAIDSFYNPPTRNSETFDGSTETDYTSVRHLSVMQVLYGAARRIINLSARK
jgi:hypothetical protein